MLPVSKSASCSNVGQAAGFLASFSAFEGLAHRESVQNALTPSLPNRLSERVLQYDKCRLNTTISLHSGIKPRRTALLRPFAERLFEPIWAFQNSFSVAKVVMLLDAMQTTEPSSASANSIGPINGLKCRLVRDIGRGL